MPDRPTILIVDDESVNLDLLSGLFESEYTVVAATSGAQTLSRVKNGRRPHLIILDIAMPGMDGFEVCRRLKQDPSTSDIPIIFCSAMSDTFDEAKGLELGATDYITKPISVPIVLARVRAVLERTRLQRELDELRERFTAMIVHDLRDPLSAITGFASLALLDDTIQRSPAALEAIQQIVQNSELAGKLISQMLDLARLRAGRVQLQAEQTDIAALLRSVVSQQSVLAQSKQVELGLDVAQGLSARVDAVRIGEVVSNLIGNAIKFSPRDSRILVRADSNADTVQISVADAGPGIPPELSQQVFLPWEQLPTGDRGLVKGYGLGLAICKMIVDAHGGTIAVRENPGGGSVFEFTVPKA